VTFDKVVVKLLQKLNTKLSNYKTSPQNNNETSKLNNECVELWAQIHQQAINNEVIKHDAHDAMASPTFFYRHLLAIAKTTANVPEIVTIKKGLLKHRRPQHKMSSPIGYTPGQLQAYYGSNQGSNSISREAIIRAIGYTSFKV